MPEFIQSAVVDNLLNTIEHCMEDANRTTAFTDALYGINSLVVYKAVISILKCVVEDSVKEHFVRNSTQRNIAELGTAISGMAAKEKRGIKERVAESIELCRGFTPVTRPLEVIESLIEFLAKVGCLDKYATSTNEFGNDNSYVFTHNALMNYSVEETIREIGKIEGLDQLVFTEGIRQAAEGALNENIVFAHLLRAKIEGDIVFKYRDLEGREIDAVVINRETKTLKLIGVKSKPEIDTRLITDEAKHLFDDAILRNIGADESFRVSRVLVYKGRTGFVPHHSEMVLLANIQEFLANYRNLNQFLPAFLHRQTIYDTVSRGLRPNIYSALLLFYSCFAAALRYSYARKFCQWLMQYCATKAP